jgi:hypothetical protein
MNVVSLPIIFPFNFVKYASNRTILQLAGFLRSIGR